MNPERSRIAIDTKCHHSTSEITQTKVAGRPIGGQVEFITCTVGDTTYSGCSRTALSVVARGAVRPRSARRRLLDTQHSNRGSKGARELAAGVIRGLDGDDDAVA